MRLENLLVGLIEGQQLVVDVEDTRDLLGADAGDVLVRIVVDHAVEGCYSVQYGERNCVESDAKTDTVRSQPVSQGVPQLVVRDGALDLNVIAHGFRVFDFLHSVRQVALVDTDWRRPESDYLVFRGGLDSIVQRLAA